MSLIIEWNASANMLYLLKNLLLLIIVIFKLKCNNLIFNEIMILNVSYVCLHAFSLRRESPDPDPERRTPHFWGGSVTLFIFLYVLFVVSFFLFVILAQVHCQECWISSLTLWIHLAHSSYELQQFFSFPALASFSFFPALASCSFFSFYFLCLFCLRFITFLEVGLSEIFILLTFPALAYFSFLLPLSLLS
jgi:hypothetical protein